MRAFIAMLLPEPERVALREAQIRMRGAVRGVGPKWVDPSQLHVTIKFLGEVERGLQKELTALLGTLAGNTAPIPTRFEQITTLGPPARARVIVATLADPLGGFASLAQELDSECQRFGIGSETRKFVPHVTVARIKHPHNPSAYLARAGLVGSEFVGRELVLYESELGPAGARHTALHRTQLTDQRCRLRMP